MNEKSISGNTEAGLTVVELACFLIDARQDIATKPNEQQRVLKEEIDNLYFVLNRAFEQQRRNFIKD